MKTEPTDDDRFDRAQALVAIVAPHHRGLAQSALDLIRAAHGSQPGSDRSGDAFSASRWCDVAGQSEFRAGRYNSAHALWAISDSRISMHGLEYHEFCARQDVGAS